MSDLIDRQAVLKAINNMQKESESVLVYAALRNIEEIVKDLPSAEPETHDKRTETHSCDLISRQALCEYALNQKDKNVTPNDIMRFPSADLQSTCNQLATDCISRQAELDAIASVTERYINNLPPMLDKKEVMDTIKALPSAQPEITEEDVKEYCRKRCLVVLTSDLYAEMKKRWSSAQPELIRCKDCVYRSIIPGSDQHYWCNQWYASVFDENGYCSRGRSE